MKKTEYRVIKTINYFDGKICFEVQKKHRLWLFGDKWKVVGTRFSVLRYTTRDNAMKAYDQLIKGDQEICSNA